LQVPGDLEAILNVTALDIGDDGFAPRVEAEITHSDAVEQ